MQLATPGCTILRFPPVPEHYPALAWTSGVWTRLPASPRLWCFKKADILDRLSEH
jgi:hypothetical protein